MHIENGVVVLVLRRMYLAQLTRSSLIAISDRRVETQKRVDYPISNYYCMKWLTTRTRLAT